MDMIEEVGDRKQTIIVKTDQEPAIRVLIADIVEEREEGRTIVEESPKGSSGSNGVVERGSRHRRTDQSDASGVRGQVGTKG